MQASPFDCRRFYMIKPKVGQFAMEYILSCSNYFLGHIFNEKKTVRFKSMLL